jgi:hypothetical protein
VVTDQRTPIGVQVKALQAMADRSAAEEMADRLEFLLNYVRD